MVVALLSTSLLRGFVLSLALLGGIVLRKARFVCSPLVFEGVPVSCFQIALLRGSFEQGSRDNLFPLGVI